MFMNTFFNKIIFIHCLHREDRKKNIDRFIEKFQLNNYYILDATYLPKNGAKGCSHSHYRAMCYAIENNLENVLIIEDDYFINEDVNIIENKLKEIFSKKDWDVIMLWWLLNGLEQRTCKDSKFLRKVTHRKYGASSTICYAVSKEMFSILKDKFLESYKKLSNVYNHNETSLKTDMIWNKIQRYHKWFIVVPKIGCQIDTKSDVHIW